MSSRNRIVLACAGSGKPTSVIHEVCDAAGCLGASHLHHHGAGELTKVAYAHAGAIRPEITIGT
jgi:hypothetical protein